MAKKREVKFQENAFKNIPEEEVDSLKQELTELFENTENPEDVGRPVQPLSEGQDICPNCGGKLIPGPVFTDPFDNQAVQIFDCPECDLPFMGKPLN